MKQRWGALVAILADLLALAGVALLPGLARRFGDLAFINSIWLGGIFFIFLAGVYILKRLRPAPWLSARPAQVLAGFFAFIVANAVAYSVGFLDSVVDLNRDMLDEPSVTLYLLLTPASWFGISLIYVLLLSTETEAADWTERRRPLLALVGLLAINLMALALVAVSRAVWLRFPPQAPWFVIGATWLLLISLFALPRLLFLGLPAESSRSPLKGMAWFSLLLYLAVLAWASIPA